MSTVTPINKLAQQYQTAMELARHKKLYQVFAEVWEHEPAGVCMTAEAYDTFKRLCSPIDSQTHVAVELDAHMAALQFESVLLSEDIKEVYATIKRSN